MSRKNDAATSLLNYVMVHSRNEHDLDGLRGRHHHLDPLKKLGERELVRDDVLDGQLLVRHHLDGLGPLPGPEVSADDGELFAVTRIECDSTYDFNFNFSLIFQRLLEFRLEIPQNSKQSLIHSPNQT